MVREGGRWREMHGRCTHLRQDLHRLDGPPSLPAGITYDKDLLDVASEGGRLLWWGEEAHACAEEAERHFDFRGPPPATGEAGKRVLGYRQHGNAVAVAELLKGDEDAARDGHGPG